MRYTRPPTIGAGTIPGATQLNIYGDDLIVIEQMTKAPNVPFEYEDGLTDTGAGIGTNGSSNHPWRGHLIHKYVAAASDHLRLEYDLDVAHSGGTGTVATVLYVDGTAACTFTSDSGITTYRGEADLSFLSATDGVDRMLTLDVKDADRNGGGTATNATSLRYLGEIKTVNSTYDSFRAGRFADDDTADVTTDLATLRDNIVNLYGWAARGVGGFRSRESDDIDAGNNNVTLFSGNLKTTKGGNLFVLAEGLVDDSRTPTHCYVHTTFNGSPLATIDLPTPAYTGWAKGTVAACTLSTAAVGHEVNDLVPIVVTGCTNYTGGTGHARVRLLYVAETAGGSIAGWETPGTWEHGQYLLGTTAGCATNLWLSTAASNVEHLAGDTGRAGFGTDSAASGTLPLGRCRTVLRYPVHKAGHQHHHGKIGVLDMGGKQVQRVYAMHSRDTGYIRAAKGTLRYPATGASPNSHNIETYSAARRYDTFDMNQIGDLPFGMLYYVEVDVLPTLTDSASAETVDYIEER